MKGASLPVCVYTTLVRSALKRSLSLLLQDIIRGKRSVEGKEEKMALPITFLQIPRLMDRQLFVQLKALLNCFQISSLLAERNVHFWLRAWICGELYGLCAAHTNYRGTGVASVAQTQSEVSVHIRSDCSPTYSITHTCTHYHISNN